MRPPNRSVIAIAALLLASFGAAVSAHAAEPAKPNIVYILADDLGYGDVKCLGGDRCKIATPNIDKLASQGMTFTDAHSNSSVCTPTRYGVLTGRYCWRTQLQQHVLGFSGGTVLIAPDRLTVPGLLKQHGYSTGCVGKWHLGWTWAGNATDRDADLTKPITDGPTARGFDYSFTFSGSKGRKAASGKNCFVENDRADPSSVENWKAEALLPTFTDKACEFIHRQAKSGSPFFLYYAPMAPHTPIVPNAEWQGRSELNHRYADFVMELDAMVGRVLDTLEANGLAKNTLVIFTSDNGFSPRAGVDALEGKKHFPSEQLRGYKADIWEGGHRVPFFARWPDRIKAGSRSDQLTCLTDFMATTAEIIGAKLPETAAEDSVSILPALLGTAREPIREAVVHHSIGGNFAIRQGQWKLVLCPDSGGWSKDAPVKTRGQLYDMSKDMGERHNLYEQHPEIVSRMTRLLEKYVAEGRSIPGPTQKNDVPVDIWKKNNKHKMETE
jgi:arylsulfatase A-like enzyme